jgi:hypothetical protein
MHQKTITIHSHRKRGNAVWRLGMWGIGISMHPEIYFSSWPAFITCALLKRRLTAIENLNGFSLVPCILMILVVAEAHILLHFERGIGNQPSCHFTQENWLKMNDKKVDYLPFSRLHSFETHGIASVARLQREEMSRSAKEHGGTGSNSTGICIDFASSV